MPFVISKTIPVVKTYSEFGITAAGETEQRSVKYTAENVSSLSSSYGTAIFRVDIEEISSIGTYVHDFVYSGTGNPLEEAEKSLLAYLTE